MDALPCSVDAPGAIVVVDGRPRAVLTGHAARRAPAPWAAGAHEVTDAIQDDTEVDRAGMSAGPGGGQERGEVRPFLVGEVAGVAG